MELNHSRNNFSVTFTNLQFSPDLDTSPCISDYIFYLTLSSECWWWGWLREESCWDDITSSCCAGSHWCELCSSMFWGWEEVTTTRLSVLCTAVYCTVQDVGKLQTTTNYKASNLTTHQQKTACQNLHYIFIYLKTETYWKKKRNSNFNINFHKNYIFGVKIFSSLITLRFEMECEYKVFHFK